MTDTHKTTQHVVLRVGALSVRCERRVLVTTIVLIAVALILAAVILSIGDYPLTLQDVIASLIGTHSDALGQYFVTEIRLPRLLVGLLVGAALGISGAIFQHISHNPLGSPDIIGFTTGAATGALAQIILFEAGPVDVAVGALVGGLATAFVVYVLAWRQGLSGLRLVLVGIGVAAVLSAVNSLLVVRASLTAAQTAAQWLAGSLNAAGWGQVALLAAVLVGLTPVAFVLSRPLDLMMMGDDSATALGVKVERTRLMMVVLGIVLVSIATAATGPIAFVALAAPQIARRVTRSARIGLGTAALMGALIVSASDIIAQRLFAPTQLPVGVVTGSLGGIYLVWLLVSEWRRNTA